MTTPWERAKCQRFGLSLYTYNTLKHVAILHSHLNTPNLIQKMKNQCPLLLEPILWELLKFFQEMGWIQNHK